MQPLLQLEPQWPHRSSNLLASDLLSSGVFLRSHVYKMESITLEELKDAIQGEVQGIHCELWKMKIELKLTFTNEIYRYQ